MARYSRRRARTRRAYRKKGRRTSRRNFSPAVRRSAKLFRRGRRSGGSFNRSGRRWKKYSFTRQVDLVYDNVSTATGADLRAQSFSCPLPAVNNMVTAATIDATAPVAPGCINWSAGMIFKMANLPNMAEFLNSGPPPAGLFEEYRLKKILVEFVPTYMGKEVKGRQLIKSDPADDDAVQAGDNAFPTPTVYFLQDHDSTSGINWPMMQEYSGVGRFRLNKTTKLWVTPNVVVPVGQSLSGGSLWSTYKKSPWITNKNLAIEHYGLRFFVQDWPGPADQAGIFEGTLPAPIAYQLRINIRYFFQVRGTQ